MNTKKTLYILILFLLVFSSCKKEFLNRLPETSISDGEFWKSANDLKLYANNWYSFFPLYNDFGTIGIYGLDADNGSDNMITMSYNKRLNGENIIPASGGWSFVNIRNVNYFLDNYKKANLSAEIVNPYLGEAYFFRAYFYFSQVKNYGNMPWINKSLNTNSPELESKQLSRSIIVDSILNDLDKAIDLLPEKSSAQVSRINKQIAQLLQARIALFEGSWEKYHANTEFGVAGSNGEKYLKIAAEVSDNLIARADGYGLDPMVADASNNNMGYWGLFNKTDYKSNTEVMLWRQFVLTLNGGHNWHAYTINGGGRGITKNMIDAYLCTDGNPINTSPLYAGDNNLLDVVKNRDPRLLQSIYVNDGKHFITSNTNSVYVNPSFDSAAEYGSPTGYQLYKGHNPLQSQQISGQGTTGLILFRFAEALLINAEAKAELGIITQSDLDNTINKLRARVQMPNMMLSNLPVDANREFPTLSPLINEIRRERRVELAFEGYRHDDLLRWAAMGIKIKGWKPLGAKKAQWEGAFPAAVLNTLPVNNQGYIEFFKNVTALTNGYNFNLGRDYLLPIPIDQFNFPANEFKQNPGWN